MGGSLTGSRSSRLLAVCVTIGFIYGSYGYGQSVADDTGPRMKVNAAGVEMMLEPGDLSNQVAYDASDNIHVVFSGRIPGQQKTGLYYRKYERETRQWSTVREFKEEDGSVAFPSILLDEQAVRVAWLAVKERGEHVLRYAQKPHERGSWLEAELNAGYSRRRPVLHRDDQGILRLVSSSSPEKGRPERVWVYESHDGGEAWTRIDPAKGNETARTWNPSLSCGKDGRCYFGWLASAGGTVRIGLAEYDREAKVWPPPAEVEIPEGQRPSELRVVATDMGAEVFWLNRSLRQYQIYMYGWNKVREEWRGVSQLLDQRGNEFEWTLTRCGREIHLVWREAQGPSHRARHSVWVSKITEETVDGGRIAPPRLVGESNFEIRSLAVHCDDGGLFVGALRSQEYGNIPVLSVPSQDERSLAVLPVGTGGAGLGDRRMLTIGPGLGSWYVAYRESRLAGPMGGGNLQGGDLFILEGGGGFGVPQDAGEVGE